MAKFTMVDIPMAYNAIMGRHILNEVQVVISTHHMLMKFSTEDGTVGEMRGDQVGARVLSFQADRVTRIFAITFSTGYPYATGHSAPVGAPAGFSPVPAGVLTLGGQVNGSTTTPTTTDQPSTVVSDGEMADHASTTTVNSLDELRTVGQSASVGEPAGFPPVLAGVMMLDGQLIERTDHAPSSTIDPPAVELRAAGQRRLGI